jgi:hypothetical protein
MSKTSSKLAAGVRTVKSQPSDVPATRTPQADATRTPKKTGNGLNEPRPHTALHPDRIWPD